MPTPILEAYTAKNEPPRTKNGSTRQRNGWTNKTPSNKNEIHEINIRTTMSEIGTKCAHMNPLYKAEKAERTTSSVWPRAGGLERGDLETSVATSRRGQRPRDERGDLEMHADVETHAIFQTHGDFEMHTKIRNESEDDRDVRASDEYSQASEKLPPCIVQTLQNVLGQLTRSFAKSSCCTKTEGIGTVLFNNFSSFEAKFTWCLNKMFV
ncbi:hypothetical protein C8R45DRAFT_933101 [Mycena sanguinolenta]|nr:hypothetical protein C8R45DRAFT_933101 [Mycena sanguinolenta]